jgi:hypothetical protein
MRAMPAGGPRIAVMSTDTERRGWAERATEALTEAGYRRGGVRSAIVELLDEQSCALSAVEIGEALAERGRGASRASVYRVMEELERIGLLARVEVGQGIVRYEPLRARPPPSPRLRALRAARAVHRRWARACDPAAQRAAAARGLRARDRDSRRLPLLRPAAHRGRQSPLRFGGIGCPAGGGSSSSSFGTVTRS